MKIARVFPQKTNMSPTDKDCYFGYPSFQTPKYDEVHISVCFTWDLPKVETLMLQWQGYGIVLLGGPAYDAPGNGFTPGVYLKQGVTITSRGCPNECPWCFVPHREGKIRELPLCPGNIVQDNNLLACSKEHIRKVFEMLRGQKQIRFAGGLEPSRITDDIVEELRSLSIRHIWLSYDQPDRKRALQKAMDRLSRHFSRDQLRCYVLIGFEGDTVEKAETRLKEAWAIGTLPFAMRYRTPEPQWDGSFLFTDRKWNLLTRQWSRPAITKSLMKYGSQNDQIRKNYKCAGRAFKG